MLTTKKAKLCLQILIPIFVAVLSFCVLSTQVPKVGVIEKSAESLEDSKMTILEMAAGTMGISVLITLIPDDIGTPIADTLANLNEYLLLVLIAIFIEKLILVDGTRLAFLVVIPVACALYLLAVFTRREVIKSLAKKIAILGIALVLVVPCSTKFTNYIAHDYLAYVDETVEELNDGTSKLDSVMGNDSESKMSLGKLADTFNTSIRSIPDLITYIKNQLERCLNSVVIVIVADVVIPILTFLFFGWLLKELFHIQIDPSRFRRGNRNENGREGKEEEE